MATSRARDPSATSSSSAGPPHPLPAALGPVLPLSTPITHSSDVWTSDLRTLFESAKDRFGDVSWEVGGAEDEDDELELDGSDHANDTAKERIWGHKAMIYARAPPAFQARYFPPTQPRASSPLGTLNPNLSSSTAYLSSSTLQIPSNGYSNGNVPSSWSTSSKRGLSHTASQVSLSSNFSSASTVRPPLRLRVGVTPQMFKAELEWLYTGEGMGEVVEWLNDREGRGPGGGQGLGLGLDGDSPGEWGKIEGPGGMGGKTERLRNDLVYMWRSKLYSDVKIILPLSASRGVSDQFLDTVSDDPSASATTATFSAHKFILASRSPYFAQLLLNTGGFKSRDRDKPEIDLPSPPFTPASLHFCLGYMYAGTLAFSNRSYDLQTAFQIHRSATYLQLSSLRSEVESRIIHEMCDSLSLSPSSIPSKLAARRIPRVWRFAAAPDVAAKDLELRTREWMIVHWGESWGKEVGEVGKRERDGLVKDVLGSLRPDKVVPFVRSLVSIRLRADADVRTVQPRGLKQAVWVDNLLGMLLEIEVKTKAMLISQFATVAASEDFIWLLEGRGFNRDLLDKVVDDAVAMVGTPEGCKEGGRLYETLVGLLVQVDEATSEPTFPIGSDNRRMVELAAAETMKHLRRRWLQVREKGGFVGLPSYILKEISDGVDQPEEELLVTPVGPTGPTRAPPRLSSSTSRSRVATDDASSLRSTILSRNATGRDSDSVSVSSRMSTTSRASVASRSTVTSRATVASNTSSVATPLRSSTSTATFPRAPSLGGSIASSSSRTPVPTLLKSTSAAVLNPTAPLRSAMASRASTSSLASTSSRQSVSSRSTPVTSPAPSASSSTPLASAQAKPTPPPRPASVSSVRSSASTLRKAPVPSPTTPVPKLPAAKTTIPPRTRTTSGVSTTSTRSVAASVKSTTAPSISTKPTTTKPAVPAVPSSPPAKPHRRPLAAASSLSRTTPVKPSVPTAPVAATTRARTVSTSSRLSTKASSPDLKTAATPGGSTSTSKALRRPSSAASLRSSPSTNGLSSATKKSSPAPPPLPTSVSSPHPTPTKSVLVPTMSAPPKGKPRSSSSTSNLSTVTPSTTPAAPRLATPPSKLLLPSPSRSNLVPSALSSPTTSNTTSSRRFHPAAAFDPPKRAYVPPVRLVPALPTFVVHHLGSSEPVEPAPGVTLIVGIPCIISLSGGGGAAKKGRCRAVARYIGSLEGEKGPWVGVELAEGQGGVEGLNDGSLGGVRYFEIPGGDAWEEKEAGGARKRKVSGSVGGGGGGDGIKRVRNHSPPGEEGGAGGGTRGLFLRPNAVVWVEGAE